ncbi:aminoacyl-tRNA hydrolase [bacterium]|nr:aminoacyl-tRNA hydrolase [bacterium]
MWFRFFFKDPVQTEDFLIIGLGNPEKRYFTTRHNIGFMFVESLASSFGFAPFEFSKKINGFVAKGKIVEKNVILLKPSTYMNNSGTAVKAAKRLFGIKPENIIVAHDEMDIAFGSQRIRKNGSSAGHNGIKSIISELETPDFTRIRLGIGKPMPGTDIADYVLSEFSEEELEIISENKEKWAEIAKTLVSESVEAAMNAFNRKN